MRGCGIDVAIFVHTLVTHNRQYNTKVKYVNFVIL